MKKFKKKEKSRRYAMQALYSWEISRNDIKLVEKYYLNDRNNSKFDVEYFKLLLREISNNIEELDEIISTYINRNLKEIDIIATNIMRIGVYELKNREEIPYKVVINEALDNMKMFGGEGGYKFVNGVLDKVSYQFREKEIKDINDIKEN